MMLIGVILAMNSALAQEEPRVDPSVRVVVFQGVEGGACPGGEALLGNCVDRALFARPTDVTPTGHAMRRAVGEMHARLYVDLAHRWGSPEVESSLGEMGFSQLTPLNEAWYATRGEAPYHAVPSSEQWLDLVDWTGGFDTVSSERNRAALLPLMRHAGPTSAELPAMMVFRGRFASRLGFADRHHDYDLMDSDNEASGPFFEQLFPYRNAVRWLDAGVYSGDDLFPLGGFGETAAEVRVAPGSDLPRLTLPGAGSMTVPTGSLDELYKATGGRFVHLRRSVFVQTGQFARDEFTSNHMRILAAMTAMSTPPNAAEKQTGLARDLVAAARGQTDVAGDVVSEAEAISTDGELRLSALPEGLIETWISTLLAEGYSVDPEAVTASFEARLRAGDSLAGLAADTREEFVRRRVQGGQDPDELRLLLARELLALLLDAAEKVHPDRVPRYRTWILMDHARIEMATALNPDAIATPAEVEDGAVQGWVRTMSAHGWSPEGIPQGQGTVDPLAVCTLLDGPAALEEPSIKRVRLDVIVASRPGAGLHELLTEAHGQLPFTMVDEPEGTSPSVKQLALLGSDQALYRLRWDLWSGWHVFWWTRPLSDSEAVLGVRTGAVCEDTVLVPRELSATLVRAALLAGNLRPTMPATAEEERRLIAAQRPDREPQDADAALAEIEGAKAEAEGEAEAARGAVEGFDASATVTGLDATTMGVLVEALAEEELTETTLYMRSLIDDAVARITDGAPVIIEVIDVAQPERHWIPKQSRTPYVRMREHVKRRDVTDKHELPASDERRFQVAGWGVLFDERAVSKGTVHPAYAATESVAPGAPRPRWEARRVTDFWLAAGVGGFPYRHVVADCRGEAEGVPPGVAGGCQTTDDGSRVSSLLSEGLSADVSAFGTSWALRNVPLGLEAGAELRMDVVRPGRGSTSPVIHRLFFPRPRLEAVDVGYVWIFRPQFGVMGGVRFALSPFPLGSTRANRRLWGAPAADGTTRAQRLQLGFRAGWLTGPGLGALEHNLLAETWIGWGQRRPASAAASFTPYRSRSLVGMYARLQVGLPASEPAAEQFLVLRRSSTFVLGLRGQLQLNNPFSVGKE